MKRLKQLIAKLRAATGMAMVARRRRNASAR